MKKGVEKAGRNIKDIYVILRVDVAVHPDKKVAQKTVAPVILSALRASYPGMSYLDILPHLEPSSKLLQVLGKNDYHTRTFYRNPENSAQLIPFDLYEHLALVGEPQRVRERRLRRSLI